MSRPVCLREARTTYSGSAGEFLRSDTFLFFLRPFLYLVTVSFLLPRPWSYLRSWVTKQALLPPPHHAVCLDCYLSKTLGLSSLEDSRRIHYCTEFCAFGSLRVQVGARDSKPPLPPPSPPNRSNQQTITESTMHRTRVLYELLVSTWGW